MFGQLPVAGSDACGTAARNYANDALTVDDGSGTALAAGTIGSSAVASDDTTVDSTIWDNLTSLPKDWVWCGLPWQAADVAHERVYIIAGTGKEFTVNAADGGDSKDGFRLIVDNPFAAAGS